MSDESNREPSDFERKIEEIKGKVAPVLYGAKLFLKSVVLPKVEALSSKMRDRAEEILEGLSADSVAASFEESLKAKRKALLEAGLTAKEADEAIERLVKRTLKSSKFQKKKGGNV